MVKSPETVEFSKQVIKNRFGFYEIEQKPTEDELRSYYAEKYYQASQVGYETQYSDAEKQYFHNKIEQKYQNLTTLLKLPNDSPKRLLDIGCGEGWTLQYFKQQNWNVLGLDFSSYGCQIHHPECLEYLLAGNIYDNLKTLLNQGQLFECIWLDNVLEHVTNPLGLLQDCQKLLAPGGILVVEVPNDFSTLQTHLYENNSISRQFWVVTPDHLSYFNREGLTALATEAGWQALDVLGDYWIDFNLFNQNTNYVEDKSTGKSCHQARIQIENLLHTISPEKTNTLYRALADMGLGRQIIAFFGKAGHTP